MRNRSIAKGGQIIRLRRVAAAVAAAIVMCTAAASLSSCGMITIHRDAFGSVTDGDSSRDGTSGTDINGTNGTDAGTDTPYTPYTPPAEYEYTGKATADERLSLIDYDMGGASVFVASSSERVAATLDPQSDDSYSAAVRERNKMIEDALGCSLNFICDTPETIEEKIETFVNAGDYYADMLALDEASFARLASRGLLCNLQSLPFFSTENEWFEESTAELSAGYGAYGVYSDAALDPNEIACVIVIGDGANEVGKMAVGGEWTWDSMLALGGAIALSPNAADADGVDGDDELNGDDETDKIDETDEIGALDPEQLMRGVADIVAAGANLRFVDVERGSSPTVRLPDELADAAAIARELCVRLGIMENEGEGVNSGAAAGGASLTLELGTLGRMAELSSIGVEWTVLPLPKLTAEQDGYESFARNDAILAIPASPTSPEAAVALLNAFAAASDEYLCDAYVQYCMYNIVGSESTLPLIALVYESARMDFVRAFGSESDSLTAASTELMYELTSDADANVERLFSRRQDAADKYLAKLFPIRD